MAPRLKQLELHGYKTFASRTVFEYPGMITAIVGPNGSGKSNIADALRWVLGEQSYMLLRGKKTEDMIFAGSEQRPRAGVASVTITFDNADNWLPIDFSEVAITRRAYRDGQNDYLINGQKIRLREIVELLGRSGLAERTYTILGQGLVDAALALKPEERRRLFEEAAGIGLYRSRKEEALNRLETTRHNLERIQDILIEIEPRLQSLEKQAKRFQEYERLKADLHILLLDWYGFHWHKQQRDLSQAREVIKAQETHLDQARERHFQALEALNENRKQIQALRQKLNEWHSRLAEMHTQQEKTSRSLAILDERKRSLGEQQNDLTTDLGRLEEEFKIYEENLTVSKEERDRVFSELEDAQAQVAELRQVYLARQVERSKVERNLREARQSYIQSDNQNVQQGAHHEELLDRLAEQQKSVDENKHTIDQTDKELKTQIARGVELENNKKTAEQNIRQAEADLTSQRKRIAELEAIRRRFLEDKNRNEVELARVSAQLEVLIQAERSFSGFSEGTRHLLQIVQQGHLNGNLRTLSSALEVPEGLEIAITAALGEYLDLITLDKATIVEPILAYLEKNAKGRVALLPFEWISQSLPVPLLEDPDIIGLASDLVKCDFGLTPALAVLLGNVIVVNNRQAARRLAGSISEPVRIVTLSGELFHQNGTVETGQVSKSVPISQGRQKRELESKEETLKDKISTFNQAIKAQEDDIEEARSHEITFTGALHKANQLGERARTQFQQSTMALDQLQRQVKWQVSQQSILVEQKSKTKKDLEQTDANLTSIKEQLNQLREQVRQFQDDLAKLTIDELQTQVSHWDTQVAVGTGALKDAEKRVEEKTQILDRNQERQRVVQTKKEEVLTSLSRIEEERNLLRQGETELAGLISELQQVMEPVEKDIKEFEGQLDEKQSVEAAAQLALTVAERYFNQAQIDLNRQRDALETLRRRIEEDFGLVAFEYAADVSGQTPLPFDGMVEQLPVIQELAPGVDENISRYKMQLRRLGSINADAHTEYVAVRERYQFTTNQVADLKKADTDLRQVIAELDEIMRRDFKNTFNAVAIEFKQMFTRLFGGGYARLILTDEEDITQAGIDIEAKLPGRREQGLSLLSGGERSLTAIALVFSLLKVSPTPFCVMDEVDAMLDELNVGRFCDLLRELSQNTQFILITHNRNTVQTADVIYGVTMGRDSISQVISLKLEEVNEEMVSS